MKTALNSKPTKGAVSWVGTWACAPQLTEPDNMPPAPGLAGNSLRQCLRVSIAGSQLRLALSNEYGETAMVLRSVEIALSTGGENIDSTTSRALSFGGSPTTVIPAGGLSFSDPLDFKLPALADLAVSISFGAVPEKLTGHPGSRMTSYLQSGPAMTAASFKAEAQTDHWYVISSLEVMAEAPSAAIVTLGDSLTDGRGSTTNGNDRWPDKLAQHLQANPATKHIAVLNMGIGGNAVVSGGLGPTALNRFNRDVLERPGVRWLIILEGVNDIGSETIPEPATALIDAYRDFIRKARAAGIKLYFMPILPFGGSFYDSPARAAARGTVNNWIRTSGEFEAVIDAEAAVRDPDHPNRLLAAYDSGDQLHLNPAGYKAIADCIDLSLFS